MMSLCQSCQRPVEDLVNAGRHPVSNRYRTEAAPQHEDLFSLVLGQCTACGLVQLTTLVPPKQLAPQFDWIIYNEPEGHLDTLADELVSLPGLGPQSIIGGITYKDDSTLRRLNERGLSHAWRLDSSADLCVPVGAGLETIQARLSESVSTLASLYDPADLLIVRHILEHAHDTRRFIAALRSLVRPGGYIMFEVPDCSQLLETLDYTIIWEEHILYFTIGTYRRTLETLGFEVERINTYPYPYENSFVAIVRAPNDSAAMPTPETGEVETDRLRAQRFAAAFAQRRNAIQSALAARCLNGKRVAIFGAGHLSCMFINVNDISKYITFVVDDHPSKRGLFMPGSGLSIKGSKALLSENIDLCLSSLSPESEEKVFRKQSEFIARGGEFASIFPSSTRAFRHAPFETVRS